ncbi:unnamed protein product [Ambrosiozyma monospora]|uniref:Unnamed protein product n=1 Tax=Ambrosiozyma monospora TaxID=43982 RepID=A0ACB5SUQ1_AMBMO|nr:unnamed protein product [Ambrosiozyma monospora]
MSFKIILEELANHRDVNKVKIADEIINIKLDTNRNDMMLSGLRMSIDLLSFGCLLFVGAAYGMNWENFKEDKENWFEVVVNGYRFMLFEYHVEHEKGQLEVNQVRKSSNCEKILKLITLLLPLENL